VNRRGVRPDHNGVNVARQLIAAWEDRGTKGKRSE
jgi:hypothetical protein